MHTDVQISTHWDWSCGNLHIAVSLQVLHQSLLLYYETSKQNQSQQYEPSLVIDDGIFNTWVPDICH